MIQQPFTILCPPMKVTNTSLWNPFADRKAQQLVCDVDTFDPAGNPMELVVVFPKCKIVRNTDLTVRRKVAADYGLASVPSVIWMVEPVVATNAIIQPTKIWVAYPEEPTVRAPLWEGGNIDVLPVSGAGEITLPNGHMGKVTSTLPRTTGRPVGLGLQKYIVDAVTCEGTVEWE